MENQEQVHKRRVRYSGTHPKSYKEKYKEHNPEKYADTVAKVIQKGSTPAGMHISIMVQEILDFLQIKPGQIGLDATLGYGGHTKAMLQCLEGQGHLYGLDVDPIESAKTKERLEKQGFGPEYLYLFSATSLLPLHFTYAVYFTISAVSPIISPMEAATSPPPTGHPVMGASPFAIALAKESQPA